jgi:hypothetical protein
MDVLKEFQAAIEIEYQKKLEEYKEQMALPLDERVAKGITMTNFKVEFDFFEGCPDGWCPPLSGNEKYIRSAKIICENNISKFKEGSSVYLTHGEERCIMDIDEDSIDNFILKSNEFNQKDCYIDSVNYSYNRRIF